MNENETRIRQIVNLSVSALRPFAGHPYRVRNDEDMDALVDSVMEYGILTPVLVRPLENGEYEIISGHRRCNAAALAGISHVPAEILDMDHDAAAIAVVDSNLHRDHILPSEKAFAYKMKLEAMRHQGASGQIGQKWSREEISDTDSGRQVQRYIRLTNLIPEFLAYMDQGKMSLSVGVELSYLISPVQKIVLEAMEYYDCTPSYSQANRLRKEFAQKLIILSRERIFEILGEEKANQRERVSFSVDDLRMYFPRGYTVKEMQNAMLRLVRQEYMRNHADRGEER